MAAALTQLTGGNFTDSEGNVLANGYLTFQLSQDGNVAGVGNLCSGITVKIQLDSTGNVAGTSSTPSVSNQYLWANSNISPINTFYKVTGYTETGQRAWGRNQQQIGSGDSFNLDTWVPNTVISWFPTVAQPLTLEINSAPASSQSLQNLEDSATVTIVDNGGGNISFTAESSSSLNVDVDGTPISSTNPINFESGSGISVTNPSAGNVLITNTSLAGNFSTPGLNGFWGPGIPTMLGLSNAEGSVSTSSNQITVFQFVLDSSWTLSNVYFYCEDGYSTQTVNFGIYSSTGVKLIDSGAISIANIGLQSSSFSSVTLPPGTYFFAQSSTSSTWSGIRSLVLPSQDEQEAILNAAGRTPAIAQAANATTGGVMPSNLGTLTGDTQGFGAAVVYWAT